MLKCIVVGVKIMMFSRRFGCNISCLNVAVLILKTNKISILTLLTLAIDIVLTLKYWSPAQIFNQSVNI